MGKEQRDKRAAMGNEIIHIWRKYSDLDEGDKCGVLEAVKTAVIRGWKPPVDTIQNQLYLEMFEELESIVKSHEELNLFQKVGVLETMKALVQRRMWEKERKEDSH
ncbi:MAG: hypothetical protein HY788_04395 [Deltaproteobacteria bacterium]|nr:hypothetical protein [Deltaproteobacteria bacterium]